MDTATDTDRCRRIAHEKYEQTRKSEENGTVMIAEKCPQCLVKSLSRCLPANVFILENAVETTDSTDVHGYSIKYKFMMIHPAGEGIGGIPE